MANKRKFSTFSLSFLDIMSCGFGAVILVFLIIRHDVNTQVESPQVPLDAEVNLLQQEITEGKDNLVAIKNTLSLLNQEFVETNGLARRINDEIDAIENMLKVLERENDDQQIKQLQKELKKLASEKKELEQQIKQGNDARRFQGQGQRQYLTGLKLDGSRTLILLDASASMLDNTIVNIIRRRNMSEQHQKQSDKWRRAIRAVEWLTAKFPLESQFQVYSFNTDVSAASSHTLDQWLAVDNPEQLKQTFDGLYQLIPKGGTNLELAFSAIHRLNPMPDNIILITDSLPTQGQRKNNTHTISSKEREALFEQAVNALPQGIPVNVLLWPMEGDPVAASAFWKLAQYTSGSFMSPSRDWP
ncbi:VWA domain-containing protein [Psychrobium sp. 1_MG-2023]|uniref:VWA domain-containing protein n=1 Tax=Psychrobium sp. 1_MG-2023 TaxID=3062624 RepID=UPI00267A689E|nr:VWA domain-containing protein [Psychrobium sp. 1_MG-2023]MDP2562581.1 VWA domain-containing protein [Psychrobium sp. 1_MG-2023]